MSRNVVILYKPSNDVVVVKGENSVQKYKLTKEKINEKHLCSIYLH